MSPSLSASSSLRAFLTSAKSSLQKAIASKEPVNLVIGNESADLDSISSSILFAYLRSQTSSISGFPSLHIPLVNIPRSDIRIRPELLALLPYVNLEPEHLITLDDLPSTESLSSQLIPENTRWCLVDHNAFMGSLGKIYSARVSGCIDHHKEENQVPHNITDEPRIIKTAGSCTSLVVNHFHEVWQKLSQAASQSVVAQPQSDTVVGADDIAVRRVWDAQIAKLALASVLVDTNDLKAEDKVTRDDENAVEFLEAKINVAPLSHAQFDRQTFFDEISKAKRNFQSMSIQDILRKDYKQWDESNSRLGISSVPKKLSEIVSRCDDIQAFRRELESFAKKRELTVFAVMTAFSSPPDGFQRELLLLSISSSAAEFPEKIADRATTELGLESWNEPSFSSPTTGMKIFRQRSLDWSRKQVAPLLREALND